MMSLITSRNSSLLLGSAAEIDTSEFLVNRIYFAPLGEKWIPFSTTVHSNRTQFGKIKDVLNGGIFRYLVFPL
jgi:hypothetical protein